MDEDLSRWSVDGGDHVRAGVMPHALMKPHDLFDEVRIEARLLTAQLTVDNSVDGWGGRRSRVELSNDWMLK